MQSDRMQGNVQIQMQTIHTDRPNLNNNSNICVGECDDGKIVYGTAVNDREGIFLGGKFCTTSQHIACHVDSNSIGTLTTRIY